MLGLISVEGDIYFDNGKFDFSQIVDGGLYYVYIESEYKHIESLAMIEKINTKKQHLYIHFQLKTDDEKYKHDAIMIDEDFVERWKIRKIIIHKVFEHPSGMEYKHLVDDNGFVDPILRDNEFIDSIR